MLSVHVLSVVRKISNNIFCINSVSYLKDRCNSNFSANGLSLARCISEKIGRSE